MGKRDDYDEFSDEEALDEFVRQVMEKDAVTDSTEEKAPGEKDDADKKAAPAPAPKATPAHSGESAGTEKPAADSEQSEEVRKLQESVRKEQQQKAEARKREQEQRVREAEKAKEEEVRKSRQEAEEARKSVTPEQKAVWDAFFNEKDYYSERRAENGGEIPDDTKEPRNAGNRRKKKKKKSIGGWIAALVVEILLVAALTYGILQTGISDKYSKVGEVQDIPEQNLDINEGVDEDVLTGFKTIALFGVDSRDNTLGKGNRSDSMMVAAINNDTKEVRIISVYRDTMLEIDTGNGKTFTSKCNAAYAYGGPELAIQTLNRNLDLNISEYVTVNFQGLAKAIDAIGGITLHLDSEEVEQINSLLTSQIEDGLSAGPIRLPDGAEDGDVVMNGVQTLAYSRIRHLDQGDITRTERQRKVLSAMVDKLKKMGTSEVNQFIDTMLPYISTSITEEDFKKDASQMLSYQLTETAGFPFAYVPYTTDEKGACLVAQNLTENVKTMQAFLFGNTDYQPTSEVSRINQEISGETGIQSKGSIPLPTPTDADSPDGGD